MNGYTNGVRKLFSVNIAVTDRHDAAQQAVNAGFNLLEFNGRVYHIHELDFAATDTGLTIDDFTF